eukprot:CAMPEP_0176172278 /NCGR_PEP_ID=MMETSP0120_2-20121206/88258_1 /TAXON_ID=160619 /ORGANISM="Kryptoperidinium foliaceum, Strain CCMP 1326" /LENGTH=66 /DNA_ID=CAMNT_0017510249 /DNA_START=1 /DNA_END=198 /DNA_ORIENTATION=-
MARANLFRRALQSPPQELPGIASARGERRRTVGDKQHLQSQVASGNGMTSKSSLVSPRGSFARDEF